MNKIFLTTLLFPIFLFSQTKDETEKWLMQQNSYFFDVYTNYEIKGAFLQSKWSFRDFTHLNNITIKDIKEVSYEHSDKYLAFYLKCNNDCAMFYNGNLEDFAKQNAHPKSVRDEQKPDKSMSENLKMNTTFLWSLTGKVDKSLIPRIQKALLHLIELNGGKAKLVAYKPKKEVF